MHKNCTVVWVNSDVSEEQLANVFSEAGPVANVEYVLFSLPCSIRIPPEMNCTDFAGQNQVWFQHW